MKCRLTLLFVWLHIILRAQTFSGHPPGLDWKKIKTKEVTILFPGGLEQKAQKVYEQIKYLYTHDSTLSSNRFKLNLVLQNQTTISNGYVGIGPFMSEFYLTPPHNPYVLGSIDWTYALTIHEYRHALQAMSSRKGLNNVLYHVLGEEAWGASYGFVVPDWFLEGDAVLSETKYSNGGRGRMPFFNQPFRALHQGDVQWSYSKIRNGSFKDLVPNHYVSGYAMVKYIDDHFGPYQWGSIIEDAIKYKGLVTPFKKSLKRHTGLSPAALYQVAIASLISDSTDVELADKVLVSNPKRNTIRDYLTPMRLNNGDLLYLERSGDRMTGFYTLSLSGVITRLTNQGITTAVDYGFTEPLITWSEITKDPRWDDRDYSDIIQYNINTKQKFKLTHRQKLFDPNPSKAGNKIVCVEYLPSGKCAMVVLDRQGRRLHTMPTPEQMVPSFLTFESGDTTILALMRGSGKTTLTRHYLSGAPSLDLLVPIQGIMANLFTYNDSIYFSSDINGRDNLYVLDPISTKVFLLTDNSVGIQQFSIKDQEVVYNYQTPSGIQIRKKNLAQCLYQEVHFFNPSNSTWSPVGIETRSNTTAPEIKNANLLDNPFKVYSWTVRPDEGGNVFRILGRNVLNTLQGSLAYALDQNEKAHTISGALNLGSILPLTSLVISKTYGRHSPKRSDPTQDSIRWNETGLRLGFALPLQYYRSNKILNLQPFIQYGLYQPDYKLSERKNYLTTSSIRSGINFSHSQIKARQHVSSRFSQLINLSWNQALNHGASSIDMNSAFNLPGLSHTHVMELQMDLHYQNLSDPYRFINRTSYISGYEPVTADRSMWLRAAYHLPLLYPDAGINGIYFLKRVRTRFYGEYMRYILDRSPKDFKLAYRSTGVEILLDGNLFNVLPLSAGIRYAHLLDKDLIRNSRKPRFEFILEQLF